MPKITAIEPQKRNPQRVNIYLDGEFAFGLTRLVAAWLKVGDDLSAEKIAALQEADAREQALQYALRLLSYRARTQAELRQRMQQHGWSEAIIEGTLERLRQNGLLDDADFAHAWVENRQTFRPRGARLLRQELRRKGLDEHIIQEALDEVDEEAAAYAAARPRAQRLRGLDSRLFRQKLIAYLTRRGFSFEIADSVARNLWEELQNENRDIPLNREV
ncbi:MAG: RecX family transcriptional regulator [Anaerolineales bacterium]